MRVDIAIERGSDLHERVKEYSRENGLRWISHTPNSSNKDSTLTNE